MINIDGISCCKRSKLSIWPLYIVINELEIESRFNIHNIILAGVCVGETKPLINELMIPIINELTTLSLGFEYENKT